jgi:sortase A
MTDTSLNLPPPPPPPPLPPRARLARRSLRMLSVLLITAGVLALLDVGITLVWQEPISYLYAKHQQDRLSGALRTVERSAPTLVERDRLARLPSAHARIAYLARALARRAGDGSPVGRIHIPRIGADFVVVNGTSVSDLKSGPGVYSNASFPGVRFPGIAGTTAIAAHRTTYLAPFRHIDALRRGDRIVLEMPYARLTYRVLNQRVVNPGDVHAAIGSVGYTRLVLSACTPLFSAAKRLLVFARLARVVPVGAGRRA